MPTLLCGSSIRISTISARAFPRSNNQSTCGLYKSSVSCFCKLESLWTDCRPINALAQPARRADRVRFWLAVAALAPIILPERADSADAKMLIAELEQELDPRYPQASRHGYSVENLLREPSGHACPATWGCPVTTGNGDLSIRSHRPVRALRLPAHRTVRVLPGRPVERLLRDTHRLTAIRSAEPRTRRIAIVALAHRVKACALTLRCAK